MAPSAPWLDNRRMRLSDLRARFVSLVALVMVACRDGEPPAEAMPVSPGIADGGGSEGTSSDLREKVPCRIPLPKGEVEGEKVYCLDVTVPEARGDSRNERSVVVHTVVFEPPSPSPSALPVLVVNGGPGIAGRAYVPYLDEDVRRRRFGDRRIVYADPRGVGASIPRLECTGATDRCLQSVRAKGVDPNRYGTVDAADDLADVLDAVGAKKALVAGGSYGSRLALELARRHPDQVEAVYLESVVAPAPAYIGRFVEGTDSALTALFRACSLDAACSARHPDPERELVAAYEVAKAGDFSLPRAGTIDEGTLSILVVEAQYHQDIVARIPDLLRAVAERDAATAEPIVTLALSRPQVVARLQNAIVSCVDFAPSYSESDFQAALSRVRPGLRATLGSFADPFRSCTSLGLTPADARSREAVTFAGPVLLATSDLDGRTPPAGAMAVASAMPQARIVELEGRTHTPALGFQYAGLYEDRCASEVLRNFLDAPREPSVPECVRTAPLSWK